MVKAIELIQGIGPEYGQKLSDNQCGTPAALLEKGATKKGRKELAEKTGISEAVILKLVNMADLFRVKGISSQYSELLKATGVDTVKELRNRNPTNLAAAMKEMNAEKKLCKQVPGKSMVENWVTQAKALDPKVSY